MGEFTHAMRNPIRERDERITTLTQEIKRLTAERNAALEAARPRPSQPTPTNDAQTIYQVGYEDGQKQGMDRMQQAIIDLLSESHPSIVARIVAMEYP